MDSLRELFPGAPAERLAAALRKHGGSVPAAVEALIGAEEAPAALQPSPVRRHRAGSRAAGQSRPQVEQCRWQDVLWSCRNKRAGGMSRAERRSANA